MTIKLFIFDVLCKYDTTLVQLRNIDVEKMLWIWCCRFLVVSKLPLLHPLYAVKWIYYPMLRQRWQNSMNLTLNYQRCEDVTNLTDFNVANSCQYNIHSTLWVELTIQRWGNVGATLLFWRCGINAATSCDLTTTLP